jgi:cell division GTPase FtsZ
MVRATSSLYPGSEQDCRIMRVLLIGVGGAGSRIADTIYSQDISLPSVRCTNGIAVDRDPDDLHALTSLPAEHRIFYQPLDPNHTQGYLPYDMIVTKLQNMNAGDIDAIVICSGLGGKLANEIPALVQRIKQTLFEPVFGLFTLPCNREGDSVLCAAADALDSSLAVLDGVILYDNEIFYGRYSEWEPAARVPEKAPFRGIIVRKTQENTQEPPPVYGMINEMIAKQVNLLLRSGEASERPGLEVGEVALDAGEILNTIMGMGCTAIGYARDPVPSTNPDIVSKLRPATSSIQEGHQKALRLVEMAKTALSDGMSVSCDPSMAEKALILIAGPHHELSMRGYMTVRHWIDRTIRGQEVRSGDYPVRNTRYVVIIILLSGLENVEKIENIRKIRDRMKKISGS